MLSLNLKTLCLALAALCFLLKALAVNLGRIDLVALGFFFVTLWALL